MTSRGESTRARILDAAGSAFARLGYDGASLTADILEPAAVSTGSFYHQFPSKRALLTALLDEATDNLRQLLDGGHRSGPQPDADGLLARATAGWNLLLLAVDAAPDIALVVRREAHNRDPEIREAVARFNTLQREAFRARLEELTVPGVDLDAVSRVVGALAVGLVEEYLAIEPERRSAERDRLAEEAARFTLSGMPGMGARPAGRTGGD
ncbi:MAG: TetR/AcrR family transcriptional regulator [Microthrixaceae bacterium]|nr:TetR/AcrR family transcriptional regulator [Microthrixaceae bacterium]